MAGTNIPKDIQDSMREVLDKRVKVAIKRMMKMETKGDKTETKVLAFTACRLYVMAAKVPSKIDLSVHYLDIQNIESKKQNQLSLTVSPKGGGSQTLTFHTLEPQTEEVDHMITHIGTTLKAIFPSQQLEKMINKIEVTPPDRIKTMYDMIKDIEGRDRGPCGGFSHMYACMCDYHELPFRDEVAWDVDTIYLSQDSKELTLCDFDHIDNRDLVPIISALEHNSWFTKLNASNTKLVPEAQVEVLKVMRKNTCIEELYLSSVGLKGDFVQKLSVAIIANSGTSLTMLDLSNNPIEDRGINHLCGPVSKLPKGLTYLNLAKTGMTAKGANRLAEALSSNKFMPTNLTYLLLAENSFKGEEVTNLYNFLAQPNAIIHLDLSSTEVALELVMGALLRGCCQNLVTLNLAHNSYSYKRGKEVQVPITWKQFFANAISLKYLNMSDCKLPPEALKSLLLGIGVNKNLSDVHLDLSCNDLRSPGATMIESCIADIPNITSLDISDNNFDQDIERVCRWIQRNRSIKHLAIGKNFTSVKPKYMHQVLDSVVQVIQEEESPIESLSLADSKLKLDTAVIINALGSNSTLKTLDISGNSMGDFGARMLAKALQINTKLTALVWDKNNTTVQGFEDIAAALQKNYTVRKMPAPFHDAAAALKVTPDRTEKALQTIERLLQRNHSPRKFASEQAFRLQQGFLISSTQQMVDKLVVHLQDTINALNMSSSDEFRADIESGQQYITDADNSKQLLPKLQEIAVSQEAEGNPVQAKLQSITQELRDLVEEQMKGTVTEMLSCAKEQCPGVLDSETVKEELEEGSTERSQFPKDFTKILIMDQVGTDVLNKISELNLSVAAYISDRMVDQVIEALGTTQKTLTNHLNTRKSLQRALPEKVQQEEKQDGESSEKEQFTIDREEKEKPSPGDSPKVRSKRQSMYMRKMRPQSVVEIKLDSPEKDTLDGPMSKSTPEPIQEDSKERGEDVDIIGDLPSLPGQKLEHLNKARPKRFKTRAATRPMKVPSVIETVEDELSTDSVDGFFEAKPVSKEHAAAHSKEPVKPKPQMDKNDETRESGSKKKGWSRFGSKDKEPKDKEHKEKEKEKKEKGGFAAGFKAGLSSLWSKGSSGTRSPEAHRKNEKSHTEQPSVEAARQPSLKSSTVPEHTKSRSPSRRTEDLKKSDSLEKLSKKDSVERGSTKTSSLERSLETSSPKSGSLEKHNEASVVEKPTEKSVERERAGSLEKSTKTISSEKNHVPTSATEVPKTVPKVEEEKGEGEEKEQDKKEEEPKREEPKEPIEAAAPVKKPMVPKFGMGFGGGILSEMKAKRESKIAKPPPSEDKPKDAKEAPQPVPAPRTRSAARASRLASEKNAEDAASEAKSPAHPSTTVPAKSTAATTAPSSSTTGSSSATAAVTTTTTTKTTTTSVSENTTPAVKVSSAQQSPAKVSSAPSPAKAESSSSKPHPTAVKAEKDGTDGPSPKQPMKPKPSLRPKPPPVAPKPKPKPRPKTGSMTPEGSPAGKDASGTKEEESTSRPSSMLEDNEDHAENSEESPGKDQTLGGSSSTEDLADKTGHSSEESLPTDVMARSRSLHGNLAPTPAAERQQKTRSLFSALSKEMESQFQKKEDQPHAFKGRNSGANDAVASQEESSALNLGGSTQQEKPSGATIEDKPSVVPKDGSLKKQQEHISDIKEEKSDKSEEHVTPPPFEGKTSEGGTSTDEFEFVDEEDVVMV